jgi:hypothetical protein
MKDDVVDTVTEDLGNVSTLEEAKSINSDDALLMSMGKKPELRRGELFPEHTHRRCRTSVLQGIAV